MIHKDWPKGLGIVIKIAHGWNSQATWYISRAVLGVLGIHLRNPYPLHRQKAFIVPGIVPEMYSKPWNPLSRGTNGIRTRTDFLLIGRNIPRPQPGQTPLAMRETVGLDGTQELHWRGSLQKARREGGSRCESPLLAESTREFHFLTPRMLAMLLTRRERLSLVGGLTLLERANWLDRIADELEERREEIASVESRDTGKPIGLARNVDANRSIANFRFFAEMIKNHRDETFEMSDAMNYVSSKPVGVGALITPWNLLCICCLGRSHLLLEWGIPWSANQVSSHR